MMLLAPVLLVLAGQAAPIPLDGPAPRHPRRVAVMKTEVSGDVDPALASQLTAKLAEEVRAQTHAEVISSDEIVALLKHEKERAILGECKEQESCLAEIASALGAEVVVSSKLAKISTPAQAATATAPATDATTSWALAVSAVESQSASVVGRVNEGWGGDPLALLSLARPVVTRLFATGSIPKGGLDVVGAVSGTKIFIDGEVRGSSDLPKVADLLVGGHHVVLQAADMKPFDRWVIVEDGRTVSLPAAQEALSDPFYATWWFWTATGASVAVAGATVAGVLLLGGGGKTGVDVQLNADKALGGAR